MDVVSCVLGVILFATIIGGLAFLQHKTNFYWKMVGRKKWRELQPELEKIRDIHDRTTGEGKKINWIEKKVTKSVRRSFDKSKKAYVEYIELCNSKHLELPVNQNELENLIDITEDALLNPKEALDKELERNEKQYDDAYALVSEAGERLLNQRQEAVRLIEDIEGLVNSIACHPKSFETEIQEINIHKEQFKNTIEFGMEQRKALEASAKSAGVGVAAGAAVASMAPTAAMWVATTFGTASTGTAISALSGAAATNAALAWLGGGALAAGGGGMAAGHALLALAGPIGWGVAGTSLAVSVWFAWRKKHKIQESKKEEVVRLKNCVEALKEIKGKIEAISIGTSSLYENLCTTFSSCSHLRGHDYTTFTNDQKQALGAMVNNTKALSALLNKTIAE
ncbi:MAG: hypothetical protein LIV11_02165 [Bacillota bacterium]|nr:hypothetical protein [Bacillota bacterium]